MMAKFEIDVEPVGRGKIVVDGQDISNSVKAVSVLATAGEPTLLQLQMFGSGTLKGEGIIETYSEDPRAFVMWLKSLNRQDIDQQAMNRGGWGDSSTLTDHVLDILLEMLDETEPAADS